ncbi:transcriptional regulator [Opitutaceae bacterium TAV1]|nr:transcriptional regulator [Opitutaceae bacterium TAV1]
MVFFMTNPDMAGAIVASPLSLDELSPAEDTTTGASPIDLKELSRVLGLSIGTVSRALNHHPTVSEKTRARVMEAARRHGYVPNSAARLLKARSTLTVGVFFAPYYGPQGEINPAALNVIESLRTQLARHGMELQVLYYRNDDELRAQARAVNVGIFIGHFEQASFQTVHELGLPAIVYTKLSPYPSQVCVLADTRHAGAQAVQYLAALGHRRVALVTGPRHETPFARCREGFEQAAAEFRIPVRPEWLIELPDAQCNKEGTAEALLPLLRREASERPTAVVFASDWFALGGRKAAREAGLSVPGDLSLIGYDNLPIGAEIEPALTTFDLHLPGTVQTITRLAARLGSPQSRSLPENKREILILPDLIKRDSCACLWPLS